MFKVKYIPKPLAFPEPNYKFCDIVWWRKTDCTKNKTAYKAIHQYSNEWAEGSSAEEAVEQLLKKLPKYKIFGLLIY